MCRLRLSLPSSMKCLIVSLVVAASVTAAAAVSAQSLADVARRETARREKIKQPAKLYTDADLKPVAPPPVAAAPADAAAEEAAKPAPAESKPEEPAKDEDYWRGRITEARTALERTKGYLEAMQTRANSLNNDFYARDDPAQRAQIATERQKVLGERERLTGEVQAQTKAIADIEEEARQAGVPPGWLR